MLKVPAVLGRFLGTAKPVRLKCDQAADKILPKAERRDFYHPTSSVPDAGRQTLNFKGIGRLAISSPGRTRDCQDLLKLTDLNTTLKVSGGGNETALPP